MPPAFILSQDQTLHNEKPDRPHPGALFFNWFYAQKKGVGGISSAALRSIVTPGLPGRGIASCNATRFYYPPRRYGAARTRIALSSFQGAVARFGQRVFKLARFRVSANRLGVFFDFFLKKIGFFVVLWAELSIIVM